MVELFNCYSAWCISFAGVLSEYIPAQVCFNLICRVQLCCGRHFLTYLFNVAWVWVSCFGCTTAVLQQRPFCSFKLIYHCHYHVLISGSYDRMRLFAKIVEA